MLTKSCKKPDAFSSLYFENVLQVHKLVSCEIWNKFCTTGTQQCQGFFFFCNWNRVNGLETTCWWPPNSEGGWKGCKIDGEAGDKMHGKPDGTECFLSVGQMKERYQTSNCITNLGKGMGRKNRGGGQMRGKARKEWAALWSLSWSCCCNLKSHS